MGHQAHHKELAEGDVGEDVVCFVLPADLLRLLPEVRELLCQGACGAEVEHVLPGQGVIQEGVTHMGEQPAREKDKRAGQAFLETDGKEGRPQRDRPAFCMCHTPGTAKERVSFLCFKKIYPSKLTLCNQLSDTTTSVLSVILHLPPTTP